MKKSLILISSALLLIAGCAKEQLVDPAVQNGYDGPVTIVGATYEQFATEGETKASFNENGKFGWETAESAKFEITNGWYESTAQDISADKSKCSFQIVGDLSTDMVAVLPANIKPVRYNAQSTNDGLKVTIPASRTWVKDQSYATMLGFGANNGGNTSYSFSHLGGLAKIKVNGVPANATKFVFKTKGYKINGEFEAGKLDRNTKQTISTSTVTEADGFDEGEDKEDTYSLTFSSSDITNNSGVMEFNVPLPCGDYTNGFAFCFKDNGGAVIYSFVGSSPQKVERTDRLCLPTINIVGGGGENLPTKSVQNIPSGYEGDFLLAEAENVLLKIAPEANANDINLKYNSGQKPSNLEINIVDGETAGTFAGTISGILPETHVDFTKGTIANVEMTTSTSTFEIIYPATISTKLTVTGGNVKVKGAQVAAIEVAENAVASEETKAPVQIVVEKSSSEETFTAPAVTAKANVIVAPASGVSVNVTANGDAKVANTGEGEVSGTPLTTAQARIDDINYFTLADAVKAAPMNATEATTITLLENVTDGAGIFLADTDKKNIIIDMYGHSYTGVGPAVGSKDTENQLFHIEKGNTFALKNSVPGTGGVVSIDQNKAADFRFLIQNYADLTLEDITLDGTNLAFPDKVRYTVSNNSGNVVFKGATIKAATEKGIAFDVCKYDTYPVPTVTWTAGKSAGTVNGGIELSGGKFVVATDLAVDRPIVAIDDKDVQSVSSTLTINSGATISTASTFQDLTPGISGPGVTSLVQVRRGADLTIDGAGSIEAGAQTYSAVMVTVNNDNDEKTAILTVNGQVTITGDYYGIVGNGNRHNTKITVNGGTIKGTHDNDNHGIYHPQNGSLTINGESTQIIGYNNGIEMRAGNLVVNNGTIIGTATNTTVVPNGNGSTTKGAGIAIAPHTTGKDISVTINGGEIKGNQAISNANPQNQTSEVAVTVNGGTFSDESAIKYAATDADITIKLQADRTAGTGVFVNADQHQTITFDLNGHNFVGVAPAVGSKGTENQLFHIEKNNTFTLKNSVPSAGGVVSIDENNASEFRFIIMDYATLTLDNVTLDGTNLGHSHTPCYTLSTNYQDVTLQGNTSIIAKGDNVAFDAYAYLTDTYPTAPTVTWNSTGSVTGNIELAGGNLVIASDLGYANTIMATEGTSNLEVNATLSATDASDWYLVKAGSNGKSGVILNISGTGTLSSGTSVHCIPVTSDYGAQVNISGGNYKCYGVNTNTPDGGECVYANREGKVSISGGTFGVRKGDTVKDLLNVQNEQQVTDIQCTGGTFYGKNPADGDDHLKSSFVATGYKSTETSTGVWEVSKQN